MSSPPKMIMGMVQQSKGSSLWCITLSVESKTDTGADVTVIPLSVFRSIPQVTLNPATKTQCDRLHNSTGVEMVHC